MARKDEVFKPALFGKRIPVISLDNKWYKLMAGIEHTPHMQELEEQLKELLKRQGKLNTESKQIRAAKAKLMEEIVGVMDDQNGKQKQSDYSSQINALNQKLEEYQDELLDLPKEIEQVNYELMLETMEVCYELIAQNTQRINEIASWIADMRIELKKNVVRKQEAELKNQQIYSYMHDIFGAEVIDIFDMKYNPETEHVIKAAATSPQPKNDKKETAGTAETKEKAGSDTADSGV
ncbi:MAG: hypothetical protein J6X66_10560 [Lachnospiraceae bacterium]|nr:hypothetical protein [Lachnospiraceae bacterium]